MALAGFVCPPVTGESPGRNNTISYCVNRCSDPCTAPHVLQSLLQAATDNPHTGQVISVSMLSAGCKRQQFLRRTVRYYEEPSRLLPTFRGSLIHLGIAGAAGSARARRNRWLIEHHLELPCVTKSGQWVLSGTLDFYDPTRRTIYDLKTLQDYAVAKLVKGTNAGTWSAHIPDSYVRQLNLYRYMLESLTKHRVERLRIQVMDFGRLILTGTRVEYGYGRAKDYYTIPDVPILPNDLVVSWIAEAGDQWYRILYGTEQPPVYDDGYEWLCGRCPFAHSKYCPNPQLEKMEELQTFLV